jgi:LysM repeat protein
MNPIHILAPSLLAVALVSCATQKSGEYDTSKPSGVADAGQVNPPVTDPVNPVYDTPAAYEESGTASPAAVTGQEAPVVPAASAHANAPTHAPANANGPAIIHTVIKGDTLSGISKKYKVPGASIKQANRMTNDVVVLGRKLVIPPH